MQDSGTIHESEAGMDGTCKNKEFNAILKARCETGAGAGENWEGRWRGCEDDAMATTCVRRI